LITNVIEEQRPYYYYRKLAMAWLSLRHNKQPVTCRGRQTTVQKMVRVHGITEKEGQWLFRLANHYHPRTILVAGSSMGLVPFCLTGYASGLHCITLENEADMAAMAGAFLEKKARSPVEIHAGAYDKRLPEVLEMLPRIDCLFIGQALDAEMQEHIFNQCLSSMHGETFCIIGGIRSSAAHRQCWRKLCAHPKVTATVDLCTSGLIFFQPKLHRRTYKNIIR
jgi:predicted O-methyltransferase YrrM